MMYFPCELIVTDVLPTARSAIARSLIERHGYRQIDVAKSFGVTGSAVSQYLKGVRGGNEVINSNTYRESFYEMIDRAADAIAEGSDTVEIMCSVCTYAKDSGMMRDLCIYRNVDERLVDCLECPRVDIIN